MQSVVFGLYTPECDKWKEYTRIDTDDAFGTVIHRFIIQSMLGVPMTVFGNGKHQRAFLSLNDSIQALMIAVNNPATPGKVQTWNQLSEWHSILDVANMVKKVIGDASVDHIESPRKEYTGKHYYHYKTDNLKDLGYLPTREIFNEISYMVQVINLVDKRDTLLNVIQPKVMF